MAFDLTALAATLGAYSREHTGEVLREKINMGLASEPEAPLSAADLIRTRFFRDEQSFARVKISLQAREKSSTVVEQPNPAIEVEGALRKLRDIETITSFAPGNLENTWLDETTIYSAPSKFRQMPDLADMEFVPWIVQHMLDKFVSSIIENTLFGGVYVPGFTYVQSWGAAFDGFLQDITAAIAGGSLTNVVTTGVITAANAFDKLEDMGKAVPYNLRNLDLFLLCSEEVHDLYNEHRATKYPGENASLHPMYKQYKLRNRSRITLVPTTEMAGSQRCIITTRDNLSFNHDFRGAGPQMTYAVKDVSNIQMKISHSAGTSIDQYDELVVNDQV